MAHFDFWILRPTLRAKVTWITVGFFLLYLAVHLGYQLVEQCKKLKQGIKNKWNKKALEDDQKFLSEQEKIDQAETPVNP